MKRNIVFLSAIFLLLSGCSNFERIREVEKKTEADSDYAQRQMQNIRKPQQVVREATEQWINTKPIIQKAAKAVPACPIVINTREPVTLSQVIQRINESCHLTVTVMPDVWNYLGAGISTGDSVTRQMSGKIPDPVPDADGMVPLASVGGNRTPLASGQGSSLQGLTARGLTPVLDAVAGRLGISWRYEKGRITFYYLETKTFPVTYMDSQISYNANVVSGSRSTNGSSGGSSSSGGMSGDASSTQKTTVDISTNLYKDVKSAVGTMLTPGVGRMFMSTGYITVTDNPLVLDIVSKFIEERNNQMKRQVILNVEILSIKKTNREQVGINWDAVFSNSNLGLSLAGNFTAAADNVITGGVSIVNGKLAGSKAFLDALSTQGKVSVVTQHSAITKNLTSVPIQIANQQNYIESVTSNSTANVGTQTSLNAATITTGFNMTLLPFIQPDSQMLQLLFSMNLSDKPVITTYTSGDSKAQTPEVDLKSINQTVDLMSGQTVILSGFQQTNRRTDKEGVGSPGFFGFGGGTDSEDENTMLIVLITANLV